RHTRFSRDWSSDVCSSDLSGDAILVVGTGYSAAIPFYAERRSIALPPWAEPAQLEELFSEPKAYFGDSPLTLAIYCKYKIDSFKKNGKKQIIDAYFSGLEKVPGGRFGSCETFRVK